MSHLILELVLWMLLAFFAGCVLGCILHRLFAKREAAALEPSAKLQTEALPELVTGPGPSPDVPDQLKIGRPERPKGIAAARGGKPDNLQRISGIGAKNERTLNNLGFFHFDQIAAWTGEEIAWIDDHLKFGGRIEREEWLAQARLLAEGKDEEFEQRYGGEKG